MKHHFSVSAPGNVIQPLGVSRFHGADVLSYRSKRPGHNKLAIATSLDGRNFEESDDAPVIMHASGGSEDLYNCSDFKLTTVGHQEVATYIRYDEEADASYLALAAPAAHDWEIAVWDSIKPKRTIRATSAALVPEHKSNGHYVLYYADNRGIRLATAKQLNNWHLRPHPVLQARADAFDHGQLEVVAAHYHEQGILLVYLSRSKKRFREQTDIGLAFIAHDNPAEVLWRSDTPLWSVKGKRRGTKILGANIDIDYITLFVYSKRDKIYTVTIDNPLTLHQEVQERISLKRHLDNPIVTPVDRQAWEAMGTFNPAVMEGKDGRIHMLYRAIGEDGISRLGYASSSCGYVFDESLPYPVYTMPKNTTRPGQVQEYSPTANPSGGSWSGTEDPRMVCIDSQVYVTFNAFDGWNHIRASAVGISEDDLLDKKFRWRDPISLSPKGEIHKNWVIFPEKVNGKFAILHSISPEVQVDYVDKLEDLATGKKRINSRFGQKQARQSWDTWLRGAGPPPIKTAHGWLVLYHATDRNYPTQYRLGAKLLDLENPRKVIARAPAPILTPDMWYENDSKPGVVYACGALVKDNTLLVYYGGGDRHTCVASANIDDFIEGLLQKRKPKLRFNPVTIS